MASAAAATVVLVADGLAYTAGALVYALRRPDPIPTVFAYRELFRTPPSSPSPASKSRSPSTSSALDRNQLGRADRDLWVSAALRAAAHFGRRSLPCVSWPGHGGCSNIGTSCAAARRCLRPDISAARSRSRWGSGSRSAAGPGIVRTIEPLFREHELQLRLVVQQLWREDADA